MIQTFSRTLNAFLRKQSRLATRVVVAAALATGVIASGCVLVPYPGEDGSDCTVEQNDDGTALVTCTDGTSAVLTAFAEGDAGPQLDSDDLEEPLIPAEDAGPPEVFNNRPDDGEEEDVDGGS